MNKFKSIILLISISVSSFLMAQNPVFEETVPQRLEDDKKGPNQKSFLHAFMGYGLILGATEGAGAAINYGKSGAWNIGLRYKRKLSNFYAVGYELFYTVSTFSIKQDSFKIFPNSFLHVRENFRTNELGISLYNRFNFGKRGSRTGNFIDIGGYGTWVVGASHNFYDNFTVANNANASNTTVTNKGLIYVSDFNYGANARLGFNRLVFFGNYRISNLFNGKIAAYPELPRLIVGIQISLQ
ncbi:MAG: hypothetical protein ACK4IK_04155 [Bacteroidia bacterium]